MTFRPTLRPAVWTEHDRNPTIRSHSDHVQHPSPVVEHVCSQQPTQQKVPLYRPSTSFSHLENDTMRTGPSFSAVQSVYCPPPLTPSERLWRDRVPLLDQKGYQLRHRYQPTWSPTSENRRHIHSGEDHIMQILPQILDARRREDGRVVCIKMIQSSKRVKEIHMVQYFSSRKLANDPRNHVVPYYDSFQDVLSPSVHFLVMPSLRRFDDPDFTTVDEVVDFVTQALEGLAFLHEHNVAHHNLTADQIMMDARSLIPGGWHFVAHFCEPDGMTRIRPRQRKSYPVRYYFVGFGSCYHFPPGQRPLIDDIGCTDSDVPELSGPVVKPYDPFKLDIYTLGNVFMKCLYMKYHSLNFLVGLIDYMRNNDLAVRPSADLVLRAWIYVRDSIGKAQLETQIRARTYDEISLAMTRHVDTPTATTLTPPSSIDAEPIQVDVDEDVNEPEAMDVVEPEEPEVIIVETTPQANSASPPSSGTPVSPTTPSTPVTDVPQPPPQPTRVVAPPESEPEIEEQEFTPPVSILVPGGRSRRTTRGKGYMTGTLDLRLNTKQLNSTRTTQHRMEQQQTYMQSMTLNMELRESSTIGILSEAPPLDNVVLMHYPQNAPNSTLATTSRSKSQPSSMSLGGGPAAFLSPLTPGDNAPPRFGIVSSVGVHPYPLSAYAGTQYYGGSIQATHGHANPQQQSYFDASLPVRVVQVQPNGRGTSGAGPSTGTSTGGINIRTPASTQNGSDGISIEVGTQEGEGDETMRWQSSEGQLLAKIPTPANVPQLQATSKQPGRTSNRASQRASRRSAPMPQQRPPLEHRTSNASDASPAHPGDSPKSAGSARSDKRDIASILNI